MKSKMKWSNLWFACLLFACVVSLSVESPAAANPKRKSKNLFSFVTDVSRTRTNNNNFFPRQNLQTFSTFRVLTFQVSFLSKFY